MEDFHIREYREAKLNCLRRRRRSRAEGEEEEEGGEAVNASEKKVLNEFEKRKTGKLFGSGGSCGAAQKEEEGEETRALEGVLYKWKRERGE